MADDTSEEWFDPDISWDSFYREEQRALADDPEARICFLCGRKTDSKLLVEYGDPLVPLLAPFGSTGSWPQRAPVGPACVKYLPSHFIGQEG